MLTQEIKKKIDSARDILVGKVPDPKAQVEQITTALIYKFMDDMDKQAASLPKGKAQFFTNGFEKYAWNKMMDAKLGGQARLNLYVEAITKMSKNPHLPQLFRNVFKDAFLPYQDPETLNLFLKDINSFSYDHSENLGDAFEYLLSILGSQGDAGQFRTPRYIIDFIVDIVDPKKEDAILDPACGTAGFLISAFKHILKTNKNKPLTPDEKKRLMGNLAGYDISPDMVKLSLVNMYLHGFPSPNIHEYDTLTSDERWDERFDVILANPPFMTPKGGIRPHKRFLVQASRTEVLFVDYIVEHLNNRGRAGIIVPEGIVANANAQYYKQLRKMLVQDYLWAVVHLHDNVFLPYSDVSTSVLFIDKELAKKTDKIIFAEVNNDGFSRGIVKRNVEENDIPAVSDLLRDYAASVLNGKSFSRDGVVIVEKKEILNDESHTLLRNRYLGKRKNNSKVTFANLGNYIEESKERSGTNSYPVWSVSNEKGFILSEEYFNKRVASVNTNNYKLVKPGYFAYNPARINVGSIALNSSKETGIVSPMYVVFKIKDQKLLEKYLLLLLKSGVGISHIRNLAKGAVRKILNFSDLSAIKIPVPTSLEQKQITDDVDKANLLKEKIQNIADEIKIKIAEVWGE